MIGVFLPLVFRDFASWIRATRLQAFEVVLDQWCALGTFTDIGGYQNYIR